MASRWADLPPTHVALWRSLKLGYRAEPLLIVIAGATTIAAAVPDALFALGLKLLADAVVAGEDSTLVAAAAALGALT
ncbi:MAG: ABC transporter ATP-binding protein, partial [Actinomycetota bacterium]|nr:ABC transporter ATP-binding protein [Actinomycetota bacterium]